MNNLIHQFFHHLNSMLHLDEYLLYEMMMMIELNSEILILK